MKKYIYLVVFLFVISVGYSQSHRNCGTMASLEYLQKQNPLLKNKMALQEVQIQKWIAKHGRESQKSIITIPVVVHVIYNTNAQNISDAQIQSQIDVLNADYRRLNADTSNTPSLFDTLVADVEIEFCFAHQDPNGNWTNGVTRTSTTKTSFDLSQNDAKYTAQGGHDVWDRDKYFNIWVVPEIKDGGMSGILGYAQFPGGPAATDGVVIGYDYFGTMGTVHYPYNKGRTLTHETGHWLNLYHIWGDDGNSCSGSDQVADTPNQGSENYGCPSFPHPSCNNVSDMFMNYMDYTYDACMNMFSKGQKQRMLAAMNMSRASLITSGMCQVVSVKNAKAQANIKIYPNPSKGNITLDFGGDNIKGVVNIRVYNSVGQLVYSESCQDARALKNIELTNAVDGIYMVHIDSEHFNVVRKIEIHR
jgi:hypothetical protein